MSAHLQTLQRVMTGGTISLSIELGRLLTISAHSHMDDRMVDITFAGARIQMHRNEFTALLRLGPDALAQDADFYTECNCSGAVADLDGEDA